jgi:hypothetical protein
MEYETPSVQTYGSVAQLTQLEEKPKFSVPPKKEFL